MPTDDTMTSNSQTPVGKLPKGWLKHAAKLWQQGDRQDAIHAVLGVINASATPKPLALVLQLTYYLYLVRDYRGAAACLKAIEPDYPNSIELLRNLATTQSRSGQNLDALATLEKLIPLCPDDANAHDTLSSCLYQLDKIEQAAEAGTRALMLKDKSVTKSPSEWKLPDVHPTAWVSNKRAVIAYSLWGNNPRYLRGAIDNALTIPKIYPGWVARYYVDNTVPSDLLKTLAELGADVQIQPSGETDRHRLAWRFMVANDEDVGYFLVRDVDSVVNLREKSAVQEWLASDKWFHVMRDWKTHTDLILAGMWGGVAGVLPDMKSLLENYHPAMMETPNIDQWFLRDCLWSYVRTSCLVHDRFFSMLGSQRWPQADPPGNAHVGQDVFAAHRNEQATRLKSWIDKLPCLQVLSQKNPADTAPPAENMKLASINIATPAYGGTYASPYVKTLYRLLSSAEQHRVSFSFSEIDYADIVTARNYLISNFYFNKPHQTHLLFIDDDMGFEPELLYDMLALRHDLVGAIYPRRQLDVSQVMKHSGQPLPIAISRGTDFIGSPKNKDERTPFVEITQCGTGIMLISRECIRKMIEKCPEIVDHRRFKQMPFGDRFTQFLTPFNKIQLEDRELSEDFSFCYRWVKHCAGTILASTSHLIQHTGQFTANTRYSDRWS